MNRPIAIAPVRKTILVETTRERAFEIFTAGIDQWWPRGHSLGKSPMKQVVIEPRSGGRVYQVAESGEEIDWGRVLVWEAPKRFAFSWQISADWQPAPGEPVLSEVEVTFTEEAKGRTRLELVHRDFERLGAEGGSRMREQVNGGWAGILESYAKVAAG